jgi:type III secretory pathway component EscU
MDEKRGFFSFMWHKKYHFTDFLEPLLALPFGYALLRILEAQFNTLTFIIIFVLLLIYLPTLIVFVEGKRYS